MEFAEQSTVGVHVSRHNLLVVVVHMKCELAVMLQMPSVDIVVGRLVDITGIVDTIEWVDKIVGGMMEEPCKKSICCYWMSRKDYTDS